MFDRSVASGQEQASAGSPRSSTVLMLSTADWRSSLLTNKQFMARELSRDHTVLYIESLGLRRPELSIRDVKRVARRLRSSTKPETVGALNALPRERAIDVRSPLVVPYHRGSVRTLNRVLLERLVRDWRLLPREERVLWTYSPVTYGLEQLASRTVYHCVDLLAAFPGVDGELVLEGERRLADAGVTAIASSGEVLDHLQHAGFDRVLHWPNVAEVVPFIAAGLPAEARDPNLVVFGGNLSPHKLDCRHLEAILDLVPQVRLILAGPVAEGGGQEWGGLRRLLDRGAELVGCLSLDDLARLYGRATVGLIPYLHNDYTQGVDPLKLNEYLAAGLPVVSTSLPSLADQPYGVFCEDEPQAFARCVLDLVNCMSDDLIQARQVEARKRSWEVRGDQARTLVRQLQDGAREQAYPSTGTAQTCLTGGLGR